MNKRWLLLLPLVALLALSGCDKYFGDKTDISFIDAPEFQGRDIAYVPIQPVLDQFMIPTDIMVGFDELLYVVDSAAQQIVALDQSGRELGRLFVRGVKSVTQDRSLDLLAIGLKDTIIAGVDYELSCIYRIQQNINGSFGLGISQITKEIVHPFYFKSTFSSSDAEVRFNRLAVLANNSYYATRTGPSNSLLQFGGPDDAILEFNSADEFVTPISVTAAGGFFRDYFKRPSGIVTLTQPPQITAINSRDFFYSSLDQNNIIKVQYIEFVETENGSDFIPRQLVVDDPTQAEGFLSTPDRFSQPVSLGFTGDGTNYLFVVDSGADSLYQFTSNGLEGVRPPPGATSTQFVRASFGGTGSGLNQFNNPRAVAYSPLDQIVYVADAGNGRVLRFKLTTDFD